MFALQPETISAVAVALAAHYLYFVHGELDLAAARIATCHVVTWSSLVLLKWRLGDQPIRETLHQGYTFAGVYCAVLFLSIIIHRLFISPLRHVKGPLRLRITKLTHMWDMAFHQNCILLEDLRQQYGDVVRTGK